MEFQQLLKSPLLQSFPSKIIKSLSNLPIRLFGKFFIKIIFIINKSSFIFVLILIKLIKFFIFSKFILKKNLNGENKKDINFK
jgi:hypothetical protein